jgi:hypothetical protein
MLNFVTFSNVLFGPRFCAVLLEGGRVEGGGGSGTDDEPGAFLFPEDIQNDSFDDAGDEVGGGVAVSDVGKGVAEGGFGGVPGAGVFGSAGGCECLAGVAGWAAGDSGLGFACGGLCAGPAEVFEAAAGVGAGVGLAWAVLAPVWVVVPTGERPAALSWEAL